MSKVNKVKWYDDWLKTLPSLSEKVIAITGTTSGTGYWAAVAAIRKHAKAVLLLNRNSSRSDASYEKLSNEVSQQDLNDEVKTKLFKVECDLMDFTSVRKAAENVAEICAEFGGLDVLINNAGIMAFPDIRTKDGFDCQVQTNHLSHFLLTAHLLPMLVEASKQGRDVRIVQHSSSARKAPFDLSHAYFVVSEPGKLSGDGLIASFRRYAQTKLSNSVLMVKLMKELDSKGIKIKSVCAEPGASTTDLNSNLLGARKNPSTLLKFQAALLGTLLTVLPKQSAADGALPLIEASFGKDVSSGDFYVPKWGMTGPPVKVIEAGKSSGEKRTLKIKNQDNLWTWSEQALGETFFSKL